MAFQIQLTDVLHPRAPAGLVVLVDLEHLGQVVAELLAARVLLQVKVSPVAGDEAREIADAEWPSTIRRLGEQARAAFPTPAEIYTDEPLLVAQRAAAAIPGGAAIVSLARGGVGVQRPGHDAPEVMFRPVHVAAGLAGGAPS